MQRSSRMASSLWPFTGYVIAFFLVWTIAWVWIAYPWAVSHLDESTLSYALFNLMLRLTIWILPPFLYLRFSDHVNPFDYLKLRLYWKRGLAVGITLSLVNFWITAWRIGLPHLHRSSMTWNSILSTSILIGFIEEVPFRGFMLQKLEERFGFWVAATISSLLFVAIHVPGWFLLGTLKFANAVSIFIFGMILAIIFKYSKSLWAPIVSHSLNDFISGVLYH